MTIIFLCGVVAFLLATTYFMYHIRYAGLVSLILALVSLIAATNYAIVSQGVGVEYINGGVQPVFWLRYFEWMLTTSLVLFCIYFISCRWENKGWFILGVISNISMITLGLLGAYTYTTPFFIISIPLYLLLMWIVWEKFFCNEDSMNQKIFGSYTIAVWSVYPVVWVMGHNGFQIYGVGSESLLFLYLDLVSKVGFGLLLVQKMRMERLYL